MQDAVTVSLHIGNQNAAAVHFWIKFQIGFEIYRLVNNLLSPAALLKIGIATTIDKNPLRRNYVKK